MISLRCKTVSELKVQLNKIGNDCSVSISNKMKRQGYQMNHHNRNDATGGDLWTDGLICAFEFVQGQRKTVQQKSGAKSPHSQLKIHYIKKNCSRNLNPREEIPRTSWKPIVWDRISELVQIIQVDDGWGSQPIELSENEDDVTTADLAAPYWERPVGPTWWCHVAADHPSINAWLRNAHRMHPAISVPVIVAGGLLFELLGQSAGDPLADEDDIPIETLIAGGTNIPRTIHEVIALLTCRLARRKEESRGFASFYDNYEPRNQKVVNRDSNNGLIAE
ncbi:uncharacterized protein LOC111300967 [Durio zibethinus]|uniref:Uncharacterized protein LOC111300967 n=1 Tax=Durio zibethinus TaxID=66656 RepID=A0A6P5ZHA9_DURZI|nr:uncharacterized protein LOC111300967 [Durio zibethinus]